MAAAVAGALPGCEVLIMAAAPADFRPASVAAAKRPKGSGTVSLELVPTTDILQSTRALRPAAMTVVGFALETGDAVAKGRAKLRDKLLDLIVVNDALEEGAGFDVETNVVTILDKQGGEQQVTLRSKMAIAEVILDAVERYRA
jgi:phosphopantothenoylcysteine decarboxylase/phosphopantothenate--cysteine ligase